MMHERMISGVIVNLKGNRVHMEPPEAGLKHKHD